MTFIPEIVGPGLIRNAVTLVNVGACGGPGGGGGAGGGRRGRWGAPLIAIGAVPGSAVAILALAIIGVGNALVDVGVFTLLARLAEDEILVRVFAAFEGIITLGVAFGALFAPAMIDALGIRGALVAVGIITPAFTFASWHALHALDGRLRVRDADVALLHRIPMLRPLPEATIEQLAAGLTRSQLAADVFVFEQEEQGDDFFVIEDGHADVIGDGRVVRALGPGDGFGEIALLRGCRRTASVRTTTSLRLCTLSRSAFIAAVTGYSPSAEIGDRVVDDHLSHFRPDSGATNPAL